MFLLQRSTSICYRVWQYALGGLLLILATAVSAGNPPVLQLTAAEAFERAQQGELTIIDIRQPQEWRQTGVAEGAKRISMYHPEGGQGFVRNVLREVGGRTDAPIALICRTGNRSSQLQQAMLDYGFTQVHNISEGMVGGAAGPGWLRRGLPVESCPQC